MNVTLTAYKGPGITVAGAHIPENEISSFALADQIFTVHRSFVLVPSPSEEGTFEIGISDKHYTISQDGIAVADSAHWDIVPNDEYDAAYIFERRYSDSIASFGEEFVKSMVIRVKKENKKVLKKFNRKFK